MRMRRPNAATPQTPSLAGVRVGDHVDDFAPLVPELHPPSKQVPFLGPARIAGVGVVAEGGEELDGEVEGQEHEQGQGEK
jgi:hypothetical protein